MLTMRWLCFGLVALTLVGCEQKPTEQPKRDPLDAAPAEEHGKIFEALKAAGIKNKCTSIHDGGEVWVCQIEPDGVGPNGEPPPGRPIPERAEVNKKTFKVHRPNPGGGMGGGRDGKKSGSATGKEVG
jgi:hypothetical protein